MGLGVGVEGVDWWQQAAQQGADGAASSDAGASAKMQHQPGGNANRRLQLSNRTRGANKRMTPSVP